MKNFVLCLAGLLLFTSSAFAQKASAPMTIAGNPPLTVPGEVGAEINRNAIVCERVFSKFSVDTRQIIVRDITNDGIADYVVTTRSYLCNGQHNEFKNVKGDTYTFFLSQKNGTYLKQDLPRRAYEMKIDDSFRPPFITFTTTCDRSPSPDRYGELRVRWETNRMDVRSHSGCKSKRNDRPVAVNPPVVAPVTPSSPVKKPSTVVKRNAAPVGELEEMEGVFDDNTGIP